MPDLTRISHMATTRRAPRDGSASSPRSRFVPVAAVGVLCALSLSACNGVYLENTKPVLPALSVTEQVFQDSVRQDLLLEQSARSLAEQGVSGCDSCADVLTTVADHSLERSEVLGGLWEPWPSGPPSDAPTVPALPEPYTDAPVVARHAVESGITDLRAIDKLDDVDDRISVAGVGLGRVADGLRLAKAIGVSSTEVDAWVAPVFGVLDAEPSTLDNESKADLASAISGWDCATQLIPLYTAGPDSADGPSWAEYYGREQTEKLLTLTANLLALDVPDQRINSCVGAFEQDLEGLESPSPIDEIEQRLVSASLTLYAKQPDLVLPHAQDNSARPLGLVQLIDTIRYWNELGSVPAVPGVVVGNGGANDDATDDSDSANG